LRRADISHVTKPKRCKVCRGEYVPRTPMQAVCGIQCAKIAGQAKTAKQKADAAKAERKADKAKLIALKPRKWWLAKAKKALHAFIRARDEGKPCISCDTILRNTGRPGGDYDAGHFRSVGSAKHMELVEENIFGQCKHCNDFLASNAQEYERRLRIRMGDAHVDALKADNEPRHYSIEDFQQIEATYKAKLKQLQKEHG
jgi:hypothetical protein